MSLWTGIWGAQGAGKSLLQVLIAGQEAVRLCKTDEKGAALLHAVAGEMARAKFAMNFDIDFAPLEKILKAKELPFRHPDVYRFHNTDVATLDIAALEGRHILFDDLNAIFDSHYWDTVPPHIRLFFFTARHYRCQITYTCPVWSRADKDIRQNTHRLLHVRRRKRSRILMVDEYAVVPDPADPEGQKTIIIKKNFFTHRIRLPFTPDDDTYEINWGFLKRVAKVVEKMYDSWARIDLGSHAHGSKNIKRQKNGRRDERRTRDAETRDAAVDGDRHTGGHEKSPPDRGDPPKRGRRRLADQGDPRDPA